MPTRPLIHHYVSCLPLLDLMSQRQLRFSNKCSGESNLYDVNITRIMVMIFSRNLPLHFAAGYILVSSTFKKIQTDDKMVVQPWNSKLNPHRDL
jgi:hypothetical protein